MIPMSAFTENWKQALKSGNYNYVLSHLFIDRSTGENVRILKWNRSNFSVEEVLSGRKMLLTASGLLSFYIPNPFDKSNQ